MNTAAHLCRDVSFVSLPWQGTWESAWRFVASQIRETHVLSEVYDRMFTVTNSTTRILDGKHQAATFQQVFKHSPATHALHRHEGAHVVLTHYE